LSQTTRVLFVDDEERLRVLWPAILSREGFEVEVASNVPEALQLITARKFDVLVSDLNLGQPGDGFTVVSAMRRTQPHAVTLILTGYPAFQAALRTIHEQVDDFLIKGTDPDLLVQSIRQRLSHPKKSSQVLAKRLSQIIAENRREIIEKWYSSVERDSEVNQIQLTKADRIDHLPDILDELVRPERFHGEAGRIVRAAASKHGETRRVQRYTLGMLLQEARIFHTVICDFVQSNLLHVDLSHVVPDLIEVGDRTHLLLRDSIETFLQMGGVPHAA
jgi:DNA-binding response OmpR family regulator